MLYAWRAGRWRELGSILEDNICPTLKNSICDVYAPVDSEEECHFVLVNFRGVQSRYLTPCPSRIVSVLEILRGENESCEKHTSSTLKGPDSSIVTGLFHRKIMFRHMRFDQDQVIQGNLQGRVTCS